ncbi:MAG: PcfJ domain-containing protein [Coprobacillus cateniformis]|uniref:PcfJ domain-containing protein n=1 Tax=Coprobacillus cateniformis TaxID=100884 RepID=UPI0039946166
MRKIKVYKDKQYLVFEYDGKIVKYDLANKVGIGLKGKPVKGLQRQLKDIKIKDIIESCEDKNYSEFLKYIYKKYSKYICNSGTFLSMINENKHLEQLFSSGLKASQIPYKFDYSLNDIPKSLIKIAKEREIELSESLVKYWKHNIDAHYIAFQTEFISLTDKNLIELFTYEKNFGDYRIPNYQSVFNYLIDVYNYNPKSLLMYIDSLITYEAIDSIGYIARELYDYVKMMSTISSKFDKYPRNFLTTHKIACRNYNRLKQEFSEELFKKRIRTDYECVYKGYQFVYPKSIQEIKDEAVQQHNCVASYIDDVINGKCHILFLRKRDSLDKSLVTIEVNTYTETIVQAKGKFNRDTTEEENKVIEAWNKKFSIKREEMAA